MNSIWYGGKVIMLGSVLAFGFPIGIMIFPYKFKILNVISSISFVTGSIILIGFFILLIIELHQDKKLNAFYNSEKKKKMKISESKYECQVCGNREIGCRDLYCKICGIHFVE